MAGTLYRLSMVGIGLMGVACALPAQTPNLNSLLQNSPFGRVSSLPGNHASTPLEFRGVMVEGGVAYFSLYEAADSRSTWVRLNEKTSEDFVVRNYDEQNHQLTVDYQGGSLTLPLTAAVVSAATRPAPPPAVGMAKSPALRSAPHSPDSEADRLRRIAEEIKRRRALRQQAVNHPVNEITP